MTQFAPPLSLPLSPHLECREPMGRCVFAIIHGPSLSQQHPVGCRISKPIEGYRTLNPCLRSLILFTWAMRLFRGTREEAYLVLLSSRLARLLCSGFSRSSSSSLDPSLSSLLFSSRDLHDRLMSFYADVWIIRTSPRRSGRPTRTTLGRRSGLAGLV